MASNIGIKIANGEFYPIMEEYSQIKKRLILTTVHDDQPSVQIDLYRSAADTMTDAQYMGSLVVENIKPKPGKEPSIEMVISSDSNGEILADAVDLDTGAGGEHYELAVSLKSLDDMSREVDLPDFELENNEEPPSGLYNTANRIREKQKKSIPIWMLVLIGIILILGILAAWIFLFGGINVIKSAFNKTPAAIEQVIKPEPVKQTEQVIEQKPAAEPEPVKQAEKVIEQKPAAEPEPVKQTEPVPETTSQVPVIQAPAAPPPPRPQTTTRQHAPPTASYDVPARIPREGVNYRIRSGDTLWDISEAFYRDPWQYPRIARNNNIRNPNYIIAGRIIRIPPRN